MIKVFIHPSHYIRPALRWVWNELARNRGLDWAEVEEASQADIALDGSRIPLSENFYQDIAGGIFDHTHHLTTKAVIVDEQGQPDLLATAFYMLNCLQEYDVKGKQLDEFGRFRYEASWQHRFGLVEENVVQGLFNQVAEALGLPPGNGPGQQQSRVHLSHDMDLLNNGWIQDGKWALKLKRGHRKPWLTAKYILQQMAGKPHWGDVEAILDLHKKHGLTSTFFWIPVEGRDGLDGIRNADYRVNSPFVQRLMDQVEAAGFRNGSHKAASSLPLNEQLPLLGRPVLANRNHYLRLQLPNHFEEMEEAGIKCDHSLGFAEHIGFRTGYGLPFQPFNLKENRPYRFTIQPLNIMDVSLHQYMGLTPNEILPVLIRFLERHRTGCTISILWHNNYILSEGPYRPYRTVYEGILEWLEREGWSSS